jgi:hypothetical protein
MMIIWAYRIAHKLFFDTPGGWVAAAWLLLLYALTGSLMTCFVHRLPQHDCVGVERGRWAICSDGDDVRASVLIDTPEDEAW